MTANPKPRLRADARRNRDQIIVAAREIFAAHGPDIPMEEIARTSGVGVGTLYRHFPDWESLIRAVALASFTKVLEDVRVARAEEPTGWGALERLVSRSYLLQSSFQLAWSSARAKEILQADPEIVALRDALLAEVAQAVRIAQAEGTMRPDVGPGDIVVLFVLILRQQPTPLPDVIGLDRAIAIMLDGLRVHPNGVLPGRPLTLDDLRRWPGPATTRSTVPRAREGDE